MNLKQIINDSDTRAGRIFDLAIQFLIVLSLITFSIETLPNLSGTARAVLRVIEVGTVIVFSVEYVLRVFYAERRLRFIFSFYGLIDLLAILPFYIASGIDLRSVRVFRLLRLFRVLKFVRYGQAMKRLRIALASVKAELILFVITCGFLIYFASVGIYYFEREAQPEAFSSVFHCMWWAISTLSTVGYGDVYPITLGGKVFTSVILLIGLGMVAVPSGIIASALTNVLRNES